MGLARGIAENPDLSSSYARSSGVGTFYAGLAESTKCGLPENQTGSPNGLMKALSVYKDNDVPILLLGGSPP